MKTVVSAYCIVFLSVFGLSQEWKEDLNTARKLYKEGNYDEALKKYKSIQKTVPKNIDLSDELAQTAYRANKFDGAEKSYQKSRSSKGNAIQKAKTYHNLGNAKLKQKKYDEAVEAYKESLRNNPSDEETRYNLSEAMKRQQEQQNQNNKQNNKNNQPQNNPPQQPNPNQNKPKQDKNQEKDNSPKSEEVQKESQLADKKTERMLDDLVKKEMDTKKKMNGNKSKSKQNKTTKDW